MTASPFAMLDLTAPPVVLTPAERVILLFKMRRAEVGMTEAFKGARRRRYRW